MSKERQQSLLKPEQSLKLGVNGLDARSPSRDHLLQQGIKGDPEKTKPLMTLCKQIVFKIVLNKNKREGIVAFKGKKIKISGPVQLKAVEALLSGQKPVSNNFLMKKLYGDGISKISEQTARNRMQAIVPILRGKLFDIGITIVSEWTFSNKGRHGVQYYLAEKPVSADQSPQENNNKKKYSIRDIIRMLGRKHDGGLSKKVRKSAKSLGINVSANWPLFTESQAKNIVEKVRNPYRLSNAIASDLGRVLRAPISRLILKEFGIDLAKNQVNMIFRITHEICDQRAKGFESSGNIIEVFRTLENSLRDLVGEHREEFKGQNLYAIRQLLSMLDPITTRKDLNRLMITLCNVFLKESGSRPQIS